MNRSQTTDVSNLLLPHTKTPSCELHVHASCATGSDECLTRFAFLGHSPEGRVLPSLGLWSQPCGLKWHSALIMSHPPKCHRANVRLCRGLASLSLQEPCRAPCSKQSDSVTALPSHLEKGRPSLTKGFRSNRNAAISPTAVTSLRSTCPVVVRCGCLLGTVTVGKGTSIVLGG